MGGGEGQPHAPAALYPRQRPSTNFTGRWVGSRASLDGRKNFVPTGIRSRTVAIPTELPGPFSVNRIFNILIFCRGCIAIQFRILVTVKFSFHAVGGLWVSIVALIRNLGARGWRVIRFTLRGSARWRSHRYPFYRRLDVRRSRCGHFGKEENQIHDFWSPSS